MTDDIILDPGPKNTDREETPVVTGSNDDTANPSEPKYVPEKVFDITPDLNISPVGPDDTFQQTPPPPPKPTPTPVFPTPVIPTPPFVPPIVPPITSPVVPSVVPSTTPQVAQPALQSAVTPPTPAQDPLSVAYSSNPKAEKTIPGISALRTYEGDIANMITKKGTSTADMAIAEEKRETGQSGLLTNKEPSNSNAGKKSLLAVLSLILIGAGVVGAYYLYSLSPLATPGTVVQQQTKTTSLVPSDSQKTLAVDGLNTNTVLGQVRNEISLPQPMGTIKEIIPYVTTNGVKTRLTAQQMLSLMDVSAPNTLTRSLTEAWMLGVFVDQQNNKNAFVVVTNNFFQNSFAGMLSWESVMPDDLKRYLYPTVPTGVANAPLTPSIKIATTTTTSTTTASTTKTSASIATTTPVTPYYTDRGQFKDKIIMNKDVREFVTANGDALFLYSFVDNSHLVIAGNEATLAEIINRLEKQAFVR